MSNISACAVLRQRGRSMCTWSHARSSWTSLKRKLQKRKENTLINRLGVALFAYILPLYRRKYIIFGMITKIIIIIFYSVSRVGLVRHNGRDRQVLSRLAIWLRYATLRSPSRIWGFTAFIPQRHRDQREKQPMELTRRLHITLPPKWTRFSRFEVDRC